VSNQRTITVLLAAAILALSAGYATHWLLNERAPAVGNVSDASDVEALFATRLPDVKGEQTSVSRWRGQVMVVNFWATWCAPCREEIPSFVQIQDEFSGKNVQFVGIAADQADKVSAFSREVPVNYPLLVGNMDALDLSVKLGNKISALPFTVVIARDGRLAYRQLCILNPAKLRELLAKLG
jgi:thiol-disulfide isomerase/thioredoxin